MVTDVDGRIDGVEEGATHYVAVFTDITDIRNASAQLEHLAYHDALTQLPNRRLLSDRLDVAMAQTRRGGGLLGVAYLDLDGFKPVNDQHGHGCGDRVLIDVARRLRQAVRGGDSVARFGGDEFMMLLNKLASRAECENILARLLQLGCHFAQGYGIARPMPPDAVPDWVAGWRPEPAWRC